MTDRQNIVCLVVATAALMCSTRAAANRIVGVTSGFAPGTAPLVEIDPQTGIYVTLSSHGDAYNALAQSSQGELFAAWFSSSPSNGRVSRISAETGAPLETFNAVTPVAGTIRGLGFDAANRLYAVVNRHDAQGSPTLSDDLYEIDLANETTSLIGSLGFTGVQALDIAPNGGFFAWDVVAGLLTVDPATGMATDVSLSIGGTDSIQSIVFSPAGRLFGGRNQLYSINPMTGSFSAIGAGGGPDVRGIEWIVPEPSGLTALSCTILASLLCRRRMPERGSVAS